MYEQMMPSLSLNALSKLQSPGFTGHLMFFINSVSWKATISVLDTLFHGLNKATYGVQNTAEHCCCFTALPL